MAELEFIIALTEHRFLGSIFVPYLIQKKEQFFTVVRIVKKRDLTNSTDYQFKPFEKELVAIIEKYSDDKLVKKFSRAANVSAFYSELKSDYLIKQIKPFIESCLFEVATILMSNPVRLLKKQEKYSNLYDEDEIDVQSFFARPVFHFERTGIETHYRLNVFLQEKELVLQNQNIRVISNDPCLIIHRSKLIAFEKLTAKKLQPFFEKSHITIPVSMEEKYYAGFVLKAVRDFEVRASGFRILEEDTEKEAVLSLEKNLKSEPSLLLSFLYGDEKFLPNSNRKTGVKIQNENNDYVFVKVNRDFEWEKNILQFLSESGLEENNGYFSPPGLELLENENALYFLINWLIKNKPRFEKKRIRILQEKLEKVFFTGNQSLELSAKINGDWFDVHAIVKFGEFNIPFIKLKKFILNDIREFVLPNGETAVLPEEWFARFKNLILHAKIQGDKLQLAKHHFMLLNERIQVFDKSVVERMKQLQNLENVPVNLPDKLNATLRSYQNEGYNWMFGLQKNGFGACLADDMGLGKTLQTLALLLKLKRSKQVIKVSNPVAQNNQLDLFAEKEPMEMQQAASLIVLPTSLIHNWENEIRKFTPGLKTYKYIGTQRKKAVELEKIAQFYDVILTTYGTVRNDSKILSSTEFFYLILDESQFIKNSSSKTYKAIMELQAKHRLVLTGTPIENSLSDLWSQMNFINKGILGNSSFFRKVFITPIEKFNNQEQKDKLQLMIKPFILRRKKMEVAKDLPPLMEQVYFCEMTDVQRKKYEHEKSVVRNAILENIEKEGVKKSSLIILQGLTKLRQLANHPMLLETETEIESGKFQEIFRMLENLVAENHRVLIFSSFVKHLELLKEKIELENWKYSLLTGKTTKREKIISHFQEDPENRIFLISLKAGGVGLNLTGADYVFIIDPWWNPAAENQAISRAHRIGQDKNVFVYRFITENSIEEKIQLLKERKSSLADTFINSNNPFQKVSQEEIISLFG